MSYKKILTIQDIMREEVLAKIIEKASKIWNADAAEMNEDTEFAA